VAKKELPPAEEGEAPKKKSRFKKILLLLILFFMLAGLSGGAYWWFFGRADAPGLTFFDSEESEEGSGEEGAMDEEYEESAEDEILTDKEGNPLSLDATIERAKENAKDPKKRARTKRSIKPVSLPSLTVNLADPPGNRSLRLGLDVEVSSIDAIPKLKANSARILDGLILIIAGRNVRELISPEGKVLLKNEIAAQLNQILGAPQVIRIYFTEFIIQ